MEKRTLVYLERDPGVVARMTDLARSLLTQTPRKFDGHVGSRGYKIDADKDGEPSRWTVEGYENGVIPPAAYNHLVRALKERRGEPGIDKLRVEYIPMPKEDTERMHYIGPQPFPVMKPACDSQRGLHIEGWELRSQVGCDLARRAA